MGSTFFKPFAVWELEYRCAGLSSCQSSACRLIQEREPVADIIVIDIPTVLDCAGTVNNLSKHNSVKWSRLQFGCARITSAICGSVNLILVVAFIGRIKVGFRVFTLLGRFVPVQDLLLSAKDLFGAHVCSPKQCGVPLLSRFAARAGFVAVRQRLFGAASRVVGNGPGAAVAWPAKAGQWGRLGLEP
jgi:hypothetical protein